MKKGTGYHLDMFLIGTFEIFCGLLGLPMLCAATGQWSFLRLETILRSTDVFQSLVVCVILDASLVCDQRFAYERTKFGLLF